MHRNKEEVIAYVETGWARDIKDPLKVLSAKPEQTFTDLGQEIHVWNVKTDKGAWWVVEGERMPMNLYPQEAYYFSSDEVCSFHIGVMTRVFIHQDRQPDTILRPTSYSPLRFVSARRKLEEAARAYTDAEEAEHIQMVGLLCRESLVSLGQEIIIGSDLPAEIETPKLGDFKNRSRLAIDRLLSGPDNAELRSHSRKVSEAAWDFCSAVTHSPNRAHTDAAICLAMTGAVHSLFENLIDKTEDPSIFGCPVCGSRRVEMLEVASENDEAQTLRIVCGHCGWEDYVRPVDEPVSDKQKSQSRLDEREAP